MSSFGGHTVSKVGQYKVSLSDGKKFSVDSPSESPMENHFRKAVPLKDTIWAEGLLPGLFTVSFRVNDYAALILQHLAKSRTRKVFENWFVAKYFRPVQCYEWTFRNLNRTKLL